MISKPNDYDLYLIDTRFILLISYSKQICKLILMKKKWKWWVHQSPTFNYFLNIFEYLISFEDKINVSPCIFNSILEYTYGKYEPIASFSLLTYTFFLLSQWLLFLITNLFHDEIEQWFFHMQEQNTLLVTAKK